MTQFLRFSVAAVAAVFVAALFQPPAAHAQLPSMVNGEKLPSLAPLIKDAAPAVVNIGTRGSVEVQQHPFMNDPFFRRFFDMPDSPQRRQTQSAGSGVIVDAREGYILTNHHVIDSAEEITVTLQDERTYDATIVGSDPGSDVAVIKIDADDLTDIKLANSEVAEVGDFVVAIGNPFGLGHSVTSGIISGLGRSGINPDGYEDFIQTDASINPGNSGGALINLRGELVGINTAILSRTGGNIGIGFAIPSNMASSIMDQIVEFGEVRRGLLGVNIYTVTPDIAEAYGVDETQGALVSQILDGSAAQQAGLEVGDIIISVNGKPVDSAAELRNAIGLQRAGDEVRLVVIREGRERKIKATLGGQTQDEQVAAVDLHPGLEGAEFESVTAGESDSNGVDGVRVSAIAEQSPASRQGLRTGDVIIAVNRERVRTVAEFRDAAEGSSSLLLNIRRGNSALLLPIR
jgi:serine protease Do/serine protease DegQ